MMHNRLLLDLLTITHNIMYDENVDTISVNNIYIIAMLLNELTFCK